MPERFNKVVKRFLLWSLICGVSAAPSFALAFDAGRANVAGMLAGVLLFIVLYTALTTTRHFERLYARPFVRSTMYLGYCLRLGLSILALLTMGVGPTPFLAVDFVGGILSVSLSQAILGSEDRALRTFWGALLTTFIQGALLNVVVFVVMLAAYWIQRLVRKPPVETRGFEVVPTAQVFPADPAAERSAK